MKRLLPEIKNLTLLITFLLGLSVNAQVPQGFNYQAIARDGEGNEIPNTPLQIRIGILTSVSPPVVVYEADHNVTTNEFGLFQLRVGDPSAIPVTGNFEDIDWTIKPLFLRTQIYIKDKWQDMGSSELLSVPYAIMAQGLTGVNKLAVDGKTSDMGEAIFAVTNNNGDTVFAVFNEGVRINVGDGTKGVKGGFAIGGFDGSKGPIQELLRVTSDSTRIYVRNIPEKGVKGGFAIGGFDGSKGSTGNFLDLTPDNYFIGQEAGKYITTGKYNSVLGYKAAHNLTTGNSNTIIGHLADSSLTTGGDNIIIGQKAGFRLTSGGSNTLIGSLAGFNHTNQAFNVMIGTASGFHINASGWSGSFNTFMGINSGYQIRNSRDNVFIGTNAGYWLDNGTGNTFIGIDAGRSRGDPPSGTEWPYRPEVNATYNIFMGYRAGYNITNGDKNLAIGFESGYSIADGTGNVFLGNQAGKFETGSNKLYIANSATNPLVYGDFSSKQLGINTTNLTKTLTVGGDADISGTLTASNITAQSVNGMSSGRIFLDATGPIVSINSENFSLDWDCKEQYIHIINYSDSKFCNFWAKKIEGTTITVNSGIVANGNDVIVLSETNTDNNGFEIHFGRADNTGKLCSVWLQYFNGALVGHYIIY